MTLVGSFPMPFDTCRSRAGATVPPWHDWMSATSFRSKCSAGFSSGFASQLTAIRRQLKTVTRTVSFNSPSLASVPNHNIVSSAAVRFVRGRRGGVSFTSSFCGKRSRSLPNGHFFAIETVAFSKLFQLFHVCLKIERKSNSVSIVGLDGPRLELSPLTRMKRSASAATKWTSTSSLTSKTLSSVSGVRLNQGIFAWVSSVSGSRATLSHPITFSEAVSLHNPSNFPTTATSSITMFGQGLGFVISSAASFGATAVRASEWVSDSSLCCRMSSKSSPTLLSFFSVTTASDSTFTRSFSFDEKYFDLIRVFNSACTSALSISVSGIRFSLDRASVVQSGRGSVLPASLWVSDTHIVSKFVSGNVPCRLALSLGGGQTLFTTSSRLSFDRPSPSTSSPSNFPDSGNK